MITFVQSHTSINVSFQIQISNFALSILIDVEYHYRPNSGYKMTLRYSSLSNELALWIKGVPLANQIVGLVLEGGTLNPQSVIGGVTTSFLGCVSSRIRSVQCREVSIVSLHIVTMAPSTQADDTVSGVRKGIRAILLGPPGAGKGTQVRVHVKGRVAHSDLTLRSRIDSTLVSRQFAQKIKIQLSSCYSKPLRIYFYYEKQKQDVRQNVTIHIHSSFSI